MKLQQQGHHCEAYTINNYRIVDVLLEDIIKLPERYQQYIANLKQEGYHILGYCRKSKTTGVENVYVTVSCNSKTPMYRRDLKKKNIMNELSDVAGDAQDLIKDLAKMDKACLAIIDSAGLTTNMNDLELFIWYVTYYF
ncbi:hypothetical protein INT46_009133 [Mucor plumbeus]|uniref:Uncharacterized protein n=1 Tax=Mucor plumbeus TaxID=97098 RepID=A0A8H7RLL5_9FUNG|nr:hypothetical protein INT46_009133 [Mucor plumbeus]